MKRILILSTILLTILTGLFIGPNVDFGNDNPVSQFVDAITIGPDTAEAAGVADYTCDGTNDNVQFQLAMNTLPASGGKLTVLAGTYSFSATVTRAIDNISIEGMGLSSYFTYNAADPIFTAGGNNWSFSNLKTDAGGINVGITTGWCMGNVTLGSVVYGLRTSASENIVDNGRDLGDATTPMVAKVYASGLAAGLKPAATDATNLVWLCDGTDDNVQIQAAIDAVTTARGIVQLVGASFTIGATVVLKEGVWLRGQGFYTVLTAKTNLNADVLSGPGTVIYHCQVSDLTINGEDDHQDGAGPYAGIDISGMSVILDNVECDDIKGYGFYGDGSSVAVSGRITNCTAVRNTIHGIYLYSAYAVRIFGGYYGAASGNNNSGCGIKLLDCGELTIDGVVFDCNGLVGGADGRGIYIYGGKGVSVINCPYIGYSYNYGIEVAGACDGFVVSNNIVVSNVVSTAGLAGIMVNDTATNGIIANNRSWNEAGALTQDYGIKIGNSVTYVLVCGNDVRNNVSGGISQGTSTTLTIYGNVGYVAPGEIRVFTKAITAGAQNTVTSLQNTCGSNLLVTEVIVNLTVAASASNPTYDCGMDDDGAGAPGANDFFEAIPDTVGVYSSVHTATYGKQTVPVSWPTSGNDWVNFIITDAAGADTAGTIYIKAIGA
jgi:hypothetical protein